MRRPCLSVRYNIESNELWLSFDWNGVDLGTVESRCKRALLRADQFPKRAPAKWPRNLRAGSDKQHPQRAAKLKTPVIFTVHPYK